MEPPPVEPYKVLDVPGLPQDFYFNILDWSSQNIVALGLHQSVYLWNGNTDQVSKLCYLARVEDDPDRNYVTSVQWTENGDFLALGTNKGIIWDVRAQKMVNEMLGHTIRVGCLAWNENTICSGSRDKVILLRDARAPPGHSERRLAHHKQEVCNLKWSPDKKLLASGGNDNVLNVWDIHGSEPCQTYTEHSAAVKALAWSPHHRGLLVSGGGTADRCIRFWNTLTATPMQRIDAGAQVCNLAWSKHSPELVSTHGYATGGLVHQAVTWRYPILRPDVQMAHDHRVLYLAMSPDGHSIVTGAEDHKLRFWRVFNKEKCRNP